MRNKKLGLFKIFFAALRENQSSLTEKTKSRSKRNNILKDAIDPPARLFDEYQYILTEHISVNRYNPLADEPPRSGYRFDCPLLGAIIKIPIDTPLFAAG
jgi:hypothetical protein